MTKIVSSWIDNGILLVKMQSPPVNAMTAELGEALKEIIPEIRDSNARAVIITGTGKHFSAGGDISRFTQMHSLEDAEKFVTDVQRMFDEIAALPMPVIAAINGTALGGGLELALACDIRIAGKKASMGLPETRWGILAGAGGTQRLIRTISVGAAKKMMFSAQPVDAVEALRIGLVEQVTEDDDPLDEALELARTIAANSPRAIRNVKCSVNEGYDLPLTEGLAIERKLWADLIPHGDHIEGAKSFFERRPAVYPD